MNSVESMVTGDLQELRAFWMGTVGYEEALDKQKELLVARKSNLSPDSLLLLEHTHVVTLGRRANDTHLLTTRDELLSASIPVYETDRGGEATYHGPGQLVCYPIIDVRAANLGPVTYVRTLEKAIIEVLAHYGLSSYSVDGETGVWAGGIPDEKRRSGNPSGRKIAAIGVRISNGIAMHGFALNVSTDLSYFRHIIPCGMPDLNITTLEREIGESVSLRDCAKVTAEKVADHFGRELTLT